MVEKGKISDLECMSGSFVIRNEILCFLVEV